MHLSNGTSDTSEFVYSRAGVVVFYGTFFAYGPLLVWQLYTIDMLIVENVSTCTTLDYVIEFRTLAHGHSVSYCDFAAKTVTKRYPPGLQNLN